METLFWVIIGFFALTFVGKVILAAVFTASERKFKNRLRRD
jgi:hypothetical protein